MKNIWLRNETGKLDTKQALVLLPLSGWAGVLQILLLCLQSHLVSGEEKQKRKSCVFTRRPLRGEHTAPSSAGKLKAFFLCARSWGWCSEVHCLLRFASNETNGKARLTSKETELGQCQELSEVPPLNPQRS